MEENFPYIKITGSLASIIGARDKNSRVYRNDGSNMFFMAWIANLNEELNGDLIPSTWVPDYVGVSRAAVHKRIKAGRLTMFVFELQSVELNYLFKPVDRKVRDFSYCVRSECRAWREEVQLREAKQFNGID